MNFWHALLILAYLLAGCGYVVMCNFGRNPRWWLWMVEVLFWPLAILFRLDEIE